MELVEVVEAKSEVLRIQPKLYQWSEQGTYSLERLYNLILHPCVLSRAWYALRGNKGSGTAGIDGVTRRVVEEQIGVEQWLTAIRERLRSKAFQPTAVKRSYIHKRSGKLRPLGIPME